MAMDAGSVNGAGVGTGLAKELFDDYVVKLNISGVGAAAGRQQVADLCNSIAQTVVAHIVANVVVSTTTSSTVTVTSVSGVTTGGGVSGPGTGTSSGTGTGTVA